jgi:hypothetical protein
MRYNPNVDITKETTTLYASDATCSCFWSMTPIHRSGQIAQWRAGSLLSRVFGTARSARKPLASRHSICAAYAPTGACGALENFEEVNIRHSKFAAARFAHQAAPALEHFADSSPQHFITGIKAARERIVARKDEDRETFLRRRGFSKAETAKSHPDRT